MTIGINKVILIGFVGEKPQSRRSANGKPFAKFSLATTKAWKDNSGQMCKETQWHSIFCFGQWVEKVSQLLDKGSLCYIEGELRSYSTEDENAVMHKHTMINLQKLNCLNKPTQPSSTKDAHPQNSSDESDLNQWLIDSE